MKIKNLFCYFTFCFFFYTSDIKPEVFLSRTTVRTALRYSYFQHIVAPTKDHTLCIPTLNTVVHNTVPVIIVYFPVFVAKAVPVIQTCLTAAATFFGVHFAKKAKHKSKMLSIDSYSSNDYDNYYPDPNDPNDDKNKTNNKEHPHGIYKDADYHHKNSTNGKSPCPDNGQRCLDYSLPVKKSNQRIAIEGDFFVVLRPTRPGEYHGFKVAWKDLHDSLKQILIDHKFVKRSGKIIRQITEKHLT